MLAAILVVLLGIASMAAPVPDTLDFVRLLRTDSAAAAVEALARTETEHATTPPSLAHYLPRVHPTTPATTPATRRVPIYPDYRVYGDNELNEHVNSEARRRLDMDAARLPHQRLQVSRMLGREWITGRGGEHGRIGTQAPPNTPERN